MAGDRGFPGGSQPVRPWHQGSAPAKLEAGTHLITGRVLDPSWLSGLAISVDGEPVKIGDPYRRLPSSQSSYESRLALIELVDLWRRR